MSGYGTATNDIHPRLSDAEMMANLRKENAKLRKLCKTLYQLADESYVPFGSANRWMDDFAKAICAM